MHKSSLEPKDQSINLTRTLLLTNTRRLTSGTQVITKSPTHYPCYFARTFRVILFSIHSDEWNSFYCQHQTALRYNIYTVKWSLRNRRLRRWSNYLILAASYSLPHAHAQATKIHYKHQDSRIKKAQDQTKTKTSATQILKIFLEDIKIIETMIVKGDC
ncbi:hypothetical protein Tco_1261076 [Tanacetum coccineum]